MDSRLTGAILGLGRIGKVHLSHLQSNPRIVLKYAVDLEVSVISAVLRDFGLSNKCEPVILDDLDKVLDDPQVGWIFIATPTSTHYKLIKRCIKKGKAVFCEKPISPNIEEVKEVYQLAKNMKKPLFCGFNRRFSRGPEQAYLKIHNGEIGRVTSIRAMMRDHPGAPVEFIIEAIKAGNLGMIVDDLAVHDVDMILWFLDDASPVSVHTEGVATEPELLHTGEPDVFVSLIKFDNGVLVTLDIGYRSYYGYDVRMEILGNKGVLQLNNPIESDLVTIKSRRPEPDVMPYSFPERYAQEYTAEFNSFLDVIEGKGELPISGEHVVKVSKLISAIKESLISGKTVYLNKS